MGFHSETPFLYLFEGKPLADRKGPDTSVRDLFGVEKTGL